MIMRSGLILFEDPVYGTDPNAIFREAQFRLKSYFGGIDLGAVRYSYSPRHRSGPKDMRFTFEPSNYYLVYPDNQTAIELLRQILTELTFFGKQDVYGVFKAEYTHLYYVIKNYTQTVKNPSVKEMSEIIQTINAEIATILEELGYQRQPAKKDADEMIYLFHTDVGGEKVLKAHYKNEASLTSDLKKKAKEDLNKIFP